MSVFNDRDARSKLSASNKGGLIAYCHQPKKPSLKMERALPPAAQPELGLDKVRYISLTHPTRSAIALFE
ncbi:MAG: hypothetical protein IM550_10630 [Microcystis sp. M54BS1]|uniref:hypothetical protein n=1 Tax=unclassified Microcystis TaxID=2643300 RepID=UPI00257B3E6E|nr:MULTISPECIES: hypothetical protein [unclassified Microcystis]MCA2539664.1 hypothetical protein [Microcystis sp. M54BS1]MCA2595927.1 hypothetical protein [Microcystis sp. M38BS1]MCA2611999.1 hypothetical protein [Microcystis sp. M27BS1]MCA2507955.1 hypothetical protein [Microcystis sp. M62BS1]MCA2512335.1 hypothetical protein [Microcystis sp. M60BS1]